MKKFGFMLIFFLLLGCTNIQTKQSLLTPEEQSLGERIDSWELEDAKRILTHISSTLEPEKSEEYQTLISEKEKDKKELKKLLVLLKTAFSKNQIFIIERYTESGLRNKIKLHELKKIDLSQATIIFGNPVFNKDHANILTIINFYDDSLYLDITFRFRNGKWKITDFNERG
ncbi:MAG: hypothetical protein KAH04_06580 [Psychrilyobacter sp.]|nr:hypothetical protein [Psychrilyobacter sp.]